MSSVVIIQDDYDLNGNFLYKTEIPNDCVELTFSELKMVKPIDNVAYFENVYALGIIKFDDCDTLDLLTKEVVHKICQDDFFTLMTTIVITNSGQERIIIPSNYTYIEHTIIRNCIYVTEIASENNFTIGTLYIRNCPSISTISSSVNEMFIETTSNVTLNNINCLNIYVNSNKDINKDRVGHNTIELCLTNCKMKTLELHFTKNVNLESCTISKIVYSDITVNMVLSSCSNFTKFSPLNEESRHLSLWFSNCIGIIPLDLKLCSCTFSNIDQNITIKRQIDTTLLALIYCKAIRLYHYAENIEITGSTVNFAKKVCDKVKYVCTDIDVHNIPVFPNIDTVKYKHVSSNILDAIDCTNEYKNSILDPYYKSVQSTLIQNIADNIMSDIQLRI